MTIAQNIHALILKNEKENSYYRYDKNGSLTKIGSVSDVILEYNYYVVNNARVYELYNNWGEKIADFESKPDYVYGNNDLFIISVNENGEYEISGTAISGPFTITVTEKDKEVPVIKYTNMTFSGIKAEVIAGGQLTQSV